MSAPPLDIIVRASGERTERACIALITEQLGHPPTVVRERPFSSAVAKTFELGAHSAAPWVVAVDADVLVLSDFVDRVSGMCERMPSTSFCATALTLCRVFGGFVFRGVHLYRTSMLGEAHKLTRGINPGLRPETAVQRAMESLGHDKRFLAHAIGVHDHEQFYRHLYLKAKLRARKDEDRGRIEADLARRAPTDPDALVSLWGFEAAGKESNAPSEYDWAAPLPDLDAKLAQSGMTERPEFDAQIAKGFAERAMSNHDYRNDSATAPWIADHLEFALGAPPIVENLKH